MELWRKVHGALHRWRKVRERRAIYDARLRSMDLTILGIVLGFVGIGATILLGVPPLIRRRVAPHRTSPSWTLGAMKIGTTRVPVLTVRWAARGTTSIQGVECAVRGPLGKWYQCSTPKGTLDLRNEHLYTYIHLVTQRPFNSTVSSPTDFGKPLNDIVNLAVKGR